MVPSPSAPLTSTSTSVPPPGDIVKTVQDTATAAVKTVTDTAGVTKKTPTVAPAHEPAARQPLQSPTQSLRGAGASATSPRVAPGLPSAAGFAGSLPGLPSGFAAPSAQAPVVATASHPAATRIQNAAQSSADIAERGNSVMRGVLIALAAAAAATLAFAHVTALRGPARA